MNRAILFAVIIVASCGGPRNAPPQAEQDQSPPTISVLGGPQIPPVELGKRPPNTPMTSENMPFFDRVKYCEVKTRATDTSFKGPEYEACIEHQQHVRIILGEAIDAHQFSDADIVRCAKASRTAYEGMWYCLNGQEF